MKSQIARWLINIYAAPWTAVFLAAALGLIATFNHSLWRDEMNVWLIVRDSPSFAALLNNIHYDRAHPGLWHLIVAGLYHVFEQPIAMRLFHWGLGVGSLGLFWRYSRFSRLQKWLFTFGYLPFYEYFIVARNYAIAVLFLFAICTLWPRRHRAYWPLAVLIGLLANTNIYALWIAIAIALTLALELYFDRQLKPQKWDLIVSAGLVIAGCAIALYFILPPNQVADEALGKTYVYFDWSRLVNTLGRLFAGYYILVPHDERIVDATVGISMAIAAFSLTTLHLLKRPYALAFFWIANGLILGFSYVKYMPEGMRHFGNFYLVLVSALWLGQQSPPSSAITRHLSPRINYWVKRSQPAFTVILTTVLVAHLLGGLYEYGREFVVPLSAGRKTATYMRTHDLQDAFIVGSRDAEMAPLSGHLDRKFYYPERQAMGSYTLFFQGDREEVNLYQILGQVNALLAQHPKILLILSYELTIPTPNLQVEPIAAFEHAQKEAYYLYWVQAKPDRQSQQAREQMTVAP